MSQIISELVRSCTRTGAAKVRANASARSGLARPRFFISSFDSSNNFPDVVNPYSDLRGGDGDLAAGDDKDI